MISLGQIKPSNDIKLRLRVEDRWDHLVRRPVANPADDEEQEEAKDEQWQGVDLRSSQHNHRPERRSDEIDERHNRTLETVTKAPLYMAMSRLRRALEGPD
jgi:hypothetical protein